MRLFARRVIMGFLIPCMIGLAGFASKIHREYGRGQFSRQRNGSPE